MYEPDEYSAIQCDDMNIYSAISNITLGVLLILSSSAMHSQQKKSLMLINRMKLQFGLFS